MFAGGRVIFALARCALQVSTVNHALRAELGIFRRSWRARIVTARRGWQLSSLVGFLSALVTRLRGQYATDFTTIFNLLLLGGLATCASPPALFRDRLCSFNALGQTISWRCRSSCFASSTRTFRANTARRLESLAPRSRSASSTLRSAVALVLF